MAGTQELIRFGEGFEVDPRAFELRCSGRALKLERLPLQVLLVLIEQKGQLVTREEIAAKVWGKDVFRDTDNGINGAVRKIRQVLKDDPLEPRYVQTLSGRGYRFIAPVSEEELQIAEPARRESPRPEEAEEGTIPAQRIADEGRSETDEATPALTFGHWRKSRLLAALFSCCAIGIAVWILWMHLYGASVAHPIRSIAVLPLLNLSGDPAQDYFADGMTEELITELSRIKSLKVISHTSVREYKDTRKHLPQIARELGAGAILEGSAPFVWLGIRPFVSLAAPFCIAQTGSLLRCPDRPGRQSALMSAFVRDAGLSPRKEHGRRYTEESSEHLKVGN